jgi:hypothetical protein
MRGVDHEPCRDIAVMDNQDSEESSYADDADDDA